MAEVAFSIGDRTHSVACRDGEEGEVLALAARLNARWPAAVRAAGNAGFERTMVLVALMLADDLRQAEERPPEGAPASEAMLEAIAERLETLASALERAGRSA